MQTELVKLLTPDGLRLDGLLHVPMNSPSRLAVDAVIYLHGAASNFYSSMSDALLPALSAAGLSMLRINTRGHDVVSNAVAGGRARRQGAAYEIVDECRHDVAAAIEFLLSRGYQRVALIGHSLGAIKVVYSQAQQPHAAIKFVVAISPPRLSYRAFRSAPGGEDFFARMRIAQRYADEGKGEELMEIQIPLPLLITAASCLDKYGPAERYNLLNFAKAVPCPVLYIFGSKELRGGNVAFAGLDRALGDLSAQNHSAMDVAVVEGADHFYVDSFDALKDAIIQWPAWQHALQSGERGASAP